MYAVTSDVRTGQSSTLDSTICLVSAEHTGQNLYESQSSHDASDKPPF
jgi:hypothetical protein